MEEPAIVIPHLGVAVYIPLLSLHLHQLLAVYAEYFCFMVKIQKEAMDADNLLACFLISL